VRIGAACLLPPASKVKWGLYISSIYPFSPPRGIKSGPDNSLDVSLTLPLIWARHVISLSVRPTCSNHKFPFSGPCQPARPRVPQASRRGPFNFSKASESANGGNLARHTHTHTHTHTHKPDLQFLSVFVLIHPKRLVPNKFFSANMSDTEPLRQQ